MAFGKRRVESPVESPAPPAAIDWKKATEASRVIIDYLVAAYRDPRGTHAETVIGAAAALAGAYAQRSVQPMAPGTGYVVSDKVSEIMFSGGAIGQPLVGIILQFAESAGVPRDRLPDPQAINQRVIAAFNSSSYPPLSVPQDNYPNEWSPNASVRHCTRINALLAEYQLNAMEGAVALTAATAGLIKLTANAIDPGIATTLALEIMIGVSKMRPLEREVG
jgi:hypothetical protein